MDQQERTDIEAGEARAVRESLAIEELRSILVDMSPTDRLELLADVMQGYCWGCGSTLTEDRGSWIGYCVACPIS